MPSSARRYKPPTTARGARSSCAAVGGSAAYGCGVPLAGKAERAEGGTSGTLVTEILGAPQRETVKEKLVKCVLAPRRRRHHPPRDGSCKLAEDYSVPVGQPKSEQAPIRRPSSRGGPLHRSAPKRFFLFHRARRILFLARPKGAPAAPRAVGKGGARERAQFSPQAETELSGLCDDAMGGAPPWERPPGGASIPLAAVRRPAFSPPPRAGGLLKSASPRPGSADSVSIL